MEELLDIITISEVLGTEDEGDRRKELPDMIIKELRLAASFFGSVHKEVVLYSSAIQYGQYHVLIGSLQLRFLY